MPDIVDSPQKPLPVGKSGWMVGQWRGRESGNRQRGTVVGMKNEIKKLKKKNYPESDREKGGCMERFRGKKGKR